MDFKTFLQQREQAALACCQGDARPVNALSTNSESTTFFGPDGKVVQGADKIKSAYRDGASMFGEHGTSRLEILQCEANGDVGYWCGRQHAEVEMDGKRVPMTLRITDRICGATAGLRRRWSIRRPATRWKELRQYFQKA